MTCSKGSSGRSDWINGLHPLPTLIFAILLLKMHYICRNIYNHCSDWINGLPPLPTSIFARLFAQNAICPYNFDVDISNDCFDCINGLHPLPTVICVVYVRDSIHDQFPLMCKMSLFKEYELCKIRENEINVFPVQARASPVLHLVRRLATN